MLSRFFKHCHRCQSTLQSTFNVSRPSELWRSRGNSASEVGLFRIPALTSPEGFVELTETTLSNCGHLVNEVQDGATRHPQRRLVAIFDELSDELCRLADMADFVRLAHPQQGYRLAAEQARNQITRLVETLNTDKEIHDALKKSIDDGVCKDNEIEARVEKLFLFDFQQSGIHLSQDDRLQFVEMTQQMNEICGHFMRGCHDPTHLSGRESLPRHLQHVFNYGRKGIQISSSYCDHENQLVREAGYMAYNADRDNQRHLLDNLVDVRRGIARLVGFESFAEKELKGTLAGSPEFVRTFLEHVSSENISLARDEMKLLNKMKSQHTGSDNKVHIWDSQYYIQRAKQLVLDDISEYLPLGNCMRGISELFRNLFDITLQSVPADNGEVWHDDVIKLSVRDNCDNEIGVIYCDFIERKDKPQDCHFTIRAGRRIDQNTYQNPIIAVTLSLPPPTRTRPTLLTTSTLENLFHEMGHAVHTMLGRTMHQHVSGTRCCTDLAEVPSVLMEYFASDPRVISTFTRHWKTGENISEERLRLHCENRNSFVSMETQLQLLYSMVDQEIHGQRCSNINEVVAEIQSKHYVHQAVANTAWHQRFSHFVGYGSKYYSYLTSRAVASQIWNQCFKDDPFSRTNGQLYRKHILSHGGETEPRLLIENLLGKGTISKLANSLIYDIHASKENQ